MGTDIHLAVEKQNEDGTWHLIERPVMRHAGEKFAYPAWSESFDGDPEERNYEVFAFLADIRNGEGFAGSLTGKRVEPQVAGRGLPEGHMQRLYVDEDGYERHVPDLGYHDFTWATLGELVGLPWDMEFKSCGLVNEAEYKTYKAKGIPDSWCGGVGGHNIVVHETEAEFLASIGDKREHYVRVWWTWQPVKDCAFRRWLNTLIPLADGDLESVRVLMGFDS